MKKNYWLVILCAGGEPMAMTAPTAGDIARAYNSPALIASTTHAVYGRKWRAELRYVWERGVCRVDIIGEDAPLLLQVRNMIGASGIERVDPEAL